MTIYSCPLCSKCFNQKSHYDKHSKRIRPCVKGQNKGANSKHTKISKKIETKPMSWYHDNMNGIFNFIVNEPLRFFIYV